MTPQPTTRTHRRPTTTTMPLEAAAAAAPPATALMFFVQLVVIFTIVYTVLFQCCCSKGKRRRRDAGRDDKKSKSVGSSSNGQKQPAVLSNGQKQPAALSNGQKKPAALSNGQKQPAALSNGQKQPAALSNGQKQPAALSNGQKQPAALSNDQKQPDAFSNKGTQSATTSNGGGVFLSSPHGLNTTHNQKIIQKQIDEKRKCMQQQDEEYRQAKAIDCAKFEELRRAKELNDEKQRGPVEISEKRRTELEALLPDEPAPTDRNGITIRLRTPELGLLEDRRFRTDDMLDSLFVYAEINGYCRQQYGLYASEVPVKELDPLTTFGAMGWKPNRVVVIVAEKRQS